MPAGRHDKRIEIVSVDNDTRDSYGEPQATETVVARRWARIDDRVSREFYESERVQATAGVTVELRESYDGLTPKHLFRHGGRTLNIIRIIRAQRTNRSTGQVCLCGEVL